MPEETSNQPTDVRAQLAAHFAGNSSEHPNRWSQLWDKGDFLPWDRGAPNPALVDLLDGSDGQTVTNGTITQFQGGSHRRRKVLIPGCGRGYDVLLFASFGFDAYGLEISESAVRMCREEQRKNGHKYPIQDHSRGAGNVEFLNGDFFSDGWLQALGIGGFDVIYDYTVRQLSNHENCACVLWSAI